MRVFITICVISICATIATPKVAQAQLPDLEIDESGTINEPTSPERVYRDDEILAILTAENLFSRECSPTDDMLSYNSCSFFRRDTRSTQDVFDILNIVGKDRRFSNDSSRVSTEVIESLNILRKQRRDDAYFRFGWAKALEIGGLRVDHKYVFYSMRMTYKFEDSRFEGVTAVIRWDRLYDGIAQNGGRKPIFAIKVRW